MSTASWLAFLTIAGATAFSPGPAVALAMSNASAIGPSRALVGSLGNAVGVLVMGLACLFGLQQILQESNLGFQALKLIGAAYLVFLGWKGFTSARHSQQSRGDGSAGVKAVPDAISSPRLFGQGLLVALSNPKSLIFFAALLPQFTDPGEPDLLLSLRLVGSFALLTCASHLCYVWLAGLAGNAPGTSQGRAWLQKFFGLLLILMGISLIGMPIRA